MTESPYLLDNRQDEAADRFAALAALYDPMTAGHLDTRRIEGDQVMLGNPLRFTKDNIDLYKF